MCRLSALALLLIASSAVADGAEEAYRKLRALREGMPDHCPAERAGEFARGAQRFVESYPRSPHASAVQLWRGEALAPHDAAAAHAALRLSRESEARLLAAELELRYEAPPAPEVERWVGRPLDPCRPEGEVTALVFLGLTHPQTARFLPHLERLHARWSGKGLRLCGIAAVMDDHENQRPAQLEERLRRQRLPFPVAVDRQRGHDPSRTFSSYLGASLPWVALFDRYGRIVRLGPVGPAEGSLARLEGEIRARLAEPTYEQLYDRVLAGDAGALDRLAGIRTRETVTWLLRLRDADLAPPLRDAVHTALQGLAPLHLLRDPSAQSRWKHEQDRYRYSIARDRVVPMD